MQTGDYFIDIKAWTLTVEKEEKNGIMKNTGLNSFVFGRPFLAGLCFVALLLWSAPVLAQIDYFVQDDPSLFGLWYSDSDWGDFDNDNDLDLLMVGYGLGGVSGQGFIKFYRNDGNSTFSLYPTEMSGAGNGTARFIDLDGDNDLDALICGQVLSGVDTLRVYKNNAGVFVDCGYPFPPRVSSSASFGDYDNDGDIDILMTGGTIDDSGVGYLEIYRNEGNFSFTRMEVASPGVRSGNADFGDYNEDGWLDIVVTGSAGSSNYITKVYKGSPDGQFTLVPLTLQGLRYSRVLWADFEGDGDLDILLSGSFQNEAPSLFKLYRNDGNDTFQDVTQSAVMGERQGDMVCGDINNDGYNDIVLNGLITNSTTVANVYLFDHVSGQYVDSQQMIYLKYAAMALGDYNNDTRLDMSLSGHYDYQDYWNVLYYNDYTANNLPPTPPLDLQAGITGNDVLLSWSGAIDDTTPAAALTYNVRVGTTPGGNEIVSSMASSTGWRKVARPGNAGEKLFLYLNDLPDGQYYWSVQAIDNSFAGSPFAAEMSFVLGPVSSQDELAPVIAGLKVSPNPFNGNTEIRVKPRSPKAGKIEIFNCRGQKVRTLVNGDVLTDATVYRWDGADDSHGSLPSGVYTLKVTIDKQSTLKRLTLVK